ncbi:MAG: restriction endonuclease, SacI family [Thermoleophilia bacterium]
MIVLSQQDLELALEEGVAAARTQPPDAVWRARVERLGASGVRTYIAALGGALLAKATDPRVDSLAQDAKAGPRGYSLRAVAEFLAAHNGGRYHLGATGKNPLNNRPFLGGPSRIDEFQKVSRRARPAYEEFLAALRRLNQLDRSEAARALATFLHVRIQVADEERVRSQQSLVVGSDLAPADLLDVCEQFALHRTEGGRKGQALAAAVLASVLADEVVLQPIHDPSPADVRVVRAGNVSLAVEVKQVQTGEDVALGLASSARALGAGAALLVVLAPHHVALDRERIRRVALREQGIALEICESVRELVGAMCVFTATGIGEVASRLPGSYAERMRVHEVSDEAQREWRELMTARDVDT